MTVGGKYVDDLAPPDSLYATFVRSPMAHAEITEVDLADALEIPGVVAIFTGTDLDLPALQPGIYLVEAPEEAASA